MAHALECSAWRFGLGVCPIGWLDFNSVRSLLQLEDGQELLHAHVGGLAEPLPNRVSGRKASYDRSGAA